METDNEVKVCVVVPAKINLFLTVDGLRSDGYHDLTTVFQTVSLHDRLSAEMIGDPTRLHPAHRRRLNVELVHDAGPSVPTGRDNLIVQAAELLLRRMGVDVADDLRDDSLVALLRLNKTIPIAAGMAGGSADAAAALLALNRLWDAGCSREELCEMAAGLGADVPFCLSGGTALATGTGTAVAEIMCRGEYHWVVGVSDAHLSTPDVYREWDRTGAPSGASVDGVLAALRTGDVHELAAAVHNDLQEPAFALVPGLRERAEAMTEAGALATIVSGSGPTLLGLAATEDDAVALAETVSEHFMRVEVASAPAGGPRREN